MHGYMNGWIYESRDEWETIKQIKNWTKNDQKLNEPGKKSVQIMNEKLPNERIEERTTELMNYDTN